MELTLVLARTVHYASGILLTGVFGFLVLIAAPFFSRTSAPQTPGAARFSRRLSMLAWLSVIAALASGWLWLVLKAQSMSGRPFAHVLSQPDIVGTVLVRTEFGHDWLLRAVVTIPLVGLIWARSIGARGGSTKVLDRLILILSATLLAAIAGAGHAKSTVGWIGVAHVSCDAVHLLAAGAWLGGLVPLVLLLGEARRAADPSWSAVARSATVRFSTLGLVSVGALIATGAVNAVLLVGSVAALTATDYGLLLLIKIGLLAVMIVVAAINRFGLAPRLSMASAAGVNRTVLRRLQYNAAIEIGVGVAILVIVGILGTTPPGIHSHHHSMSM